VDLVRNEAGRAGREPVFDALVQLVTVTGDRDKTIAELAGLFPGLTARPTWSRLPTC
jgi:hypothetical protein